jgi:transposase
VKSLLETINCKLNDAGGALNAQESQKYRDEYRNLIKKGEIECPEPEGPRKKGKRPRWPPKIPHLWPLENPPPGHPKIIM